MNESVAILLVEDDDVDIMNVERAFKKCQVNVTLNIAKNGIEALEMLRKSGTERMNPYPRIILLDINMPRMNGIEFLKEIRSDESLRQFFVFILTTSNEKKDIRAAYDQNVAGYLIKPVNYSEFVESVEILSTYWSLIELPNL